MTDGGVSSVWGQDRLKVVEKGSIFGWMIYV